ncbi:MAG: ribosome-associated translation inhibitor RaiA [Proteobacteria bacterium]|nr:ribosome-associated translation inhibitor RaiA [Pseudomonadota bacterium]
MQLTVKGKHLDVGDSLREHVKEQLTHAAQKYFRNPIEATVIFSKEKNHLFKADISVHVGGGIVLQTHHEADDPYPAFDIAAKLVSKRLSRYKDRLRDHRKYEVSSDTSATYTTIKGDESEAEGGDEPVVIAEMTTQIQTLAVSDAVMRLELGGMPALLFKNPKHGGLNMVYRRKDGNIGWVDPDGVKRQMFSATVVPMKKPSAAKKTAAAKKKTKTKSIKKRK